MYSPPPSPHLPPPPSPKKMVPLIFSHLPHICMKKSNKTTALFLRKIGNTQIDKHPDKQIDG